MKDAGAAASTDWIVRLCNGEDLDKTSGDESDEKKGGHCQLPDRPDTQGGDDEPASLDAVIPDTTPTSSAKRRKLSVAMVTNGSGQRCYQKTGGGTPSPMDGNDSENARADSSRQVSTPLKRKAASTPPSSRHSRDNGHVDTPPPPPQQQQQQQRKRAVKSLSNNVIYTGRSNDNCDACGQTGRFICCDACPRVFHFLCADPPLNEDDADTLKNWYCNQCRPVRPGPKRLDKHHILFRLYQGLEKRNPTMFAVSEAIRRQFEGVEAGKDGEYVNTLEVKPVKHQGDVTRNLRRLTDDRGEPLFCYRCNKSALHGLIIRCDYCSLPRMNKFRKEKVVDLTNEPLDAPNNGHIDIIDDDPNPVSQRYQLPDDPRVRYRVPASKIQHRFFAGLWRRREQRQQWRQLGGGEGDEPASSVESEEENVGEEVAARLREDEQQEQRQLRWRRRRRPATPEEVWDWLKSIVAFQHQVGRYLMQADPRFSEYSTLFDSFNKCDLPPPVPLEWQDFNLRLLSLAASQQTADSDKMQMEDSVTAQASISVAKGLSKSAEERPPTSESAAASCSLFLPHSSSTAAASPLRPQKS
ncbi:hypothetical protein EV182_003081, partial [Spiromyces aspiralis]